LCARLGHARLGEWAPGGGDLDGDVMAWVGGQQALRGQPSVWEADRGRFWELLEKRERAELRREAVEAGWPAASSAAIGRQATGSVMRVKRASEHQIFTQKAQLHFGRVGRESAGELGVSGARVLRHFLLARPHPLPLAKLNLADADLDDRSAICDVCLSVCLSVCLPVCLSVCLSVCLPACLRCLHLL
jgi:hypothetical protein